MQLEKRREKKAEIASPRPKLQAEFKIQLLTINLLVALTNLTSNHYFFRRHKNLQKYRSVEIRSVGP
jgi:hypothetical protein